MEGSVVGIRRCRCSRLSGDDTYANLRRDVSWRELFSSSCVPLVGTRSYICGEVEGDTDGGWRRRTAGRKMAQSRDDIKHGAAQAKLSDDEMLRVGYKHGTPLESSKISDAEPVDLFVDARRISEATENARPAEEEPNSGGLSCQGSHHTSN
ncbi:unnamed protein product [Musa banksii]